MSEHNERLADIVAQIRAAAYIQNADTPQSVLRLADRIEAAWRREKAEAEALALSVGGMVEASRHKPDPDWKATCAKCHDGEIEPDCEYYGEPNGCNSPIYGEHPKSAPVGDAAAMRELVRRIVKSLDGKAEVAPTTMTPHEVAILNQCRAALALPRRQCDVGTVGEQYNRYAEFCEQHYREYSVGKCEKCPFAEPTCKFAWAQMPYEEGGAK